MSDDQKQLVKGAAGCFGGIVGFFAILWVIVICIKILVWLINF